MNYSKFLFIACLFFIGSYTAHAACTVTTSCGTYTYDVSSLSVSASSSGGQVTYTIKSGAQVVDSFSCDGSSASASVNCSSSDGGAPGDNDPGDNDPGDNTPEFDICDFLPDFIKPYFGCN